MASSKEVELGLGIVIVVLAVVSLLLSTMTGGPVGPVSGGGQQAGAQEGQTQQPGGPRGGPSTATIMVSDTGFDPPVVTLGAGEVQITVQNTALRTHGFTLLEFNIDQLIPSKQSFTFTRTATPGTYVFSDPIVPSNTGKLIVQ